MAREGSGHALGQIDAGRRERQIDHVVSPVSDLRPTILAAWRTNSLVTSRLVEQIPSALWEASIPGIPRRTIRAIAAHLHNARSRWLKTLGQEHRIGAPPLVDLRRGIERNPRPALRTPIPDTRARR